MPQTSAKSIGLSTNKEVEMNTKRKPTVIVMDAREDKPEKACVRVPGNRHDIKLYLEFEELQDLADVLNDTLDSRVQS